MTGKYYIVGVFYKTWTGKYYIVGVFYKTWT